MLRIEIKVGIEQVRDRLGRFTGYIDHGMIDLRDKATRRVVEIYREVLEEVGIQSRTGRLKEGIGEKDRSTKGFRATVGPSADREEIATWLDEGTADRELPGTAGRVYVMQKVGEGEVIRFSIGHHSIRPRNFMDIIQKRVDRMLSEEFPDLFQVKVAAMMA